MSSPLKISFCTVSMNRLFHLQRTLIQNIADNENYPAVEFNLLNYNSNDGLDSWVKEHTRSFMDRGLFNYFKTDEPPYFDRSHSKNMVFRLATGDVVCNIDADNFTGKDFAFYVNEVMKQAGTSSMLIRSKELKSEEERNTCGRVCVYRDSFYQVNGFDESMKGYGFEDTDFVNRLIREGVEPIIIEDSHFLQNIPHSNDLRNNEDELTRNIEAILIRYINYFTSEITIVCKGSTFERAVLLDNGLMRSRWNPDPEIHETLYGDYDLCFQRNEWQAGTWERDGNKIVLHGGGPHLVLEEQWNDRGEKQYTREQQTYWFISDKHLLGEVLYLYPQIKNRIIMDDNLRTNSKVNRNGFGMGKVYKNFSEEPFQLQ